MMMKRDVLDWQRNQKGGRAVKLTYASQGGPREGSGEAVLAVVVQTNYSETAVAV